MKKNFSIRDLASCAIVSFFLVMAVGSSDSSSDNSTYSEEETEFEPATKAEPEPDFSMDISQEAIEAVEIEPDFSNDEEESASSSYVNTSEIDTTFSDAGEPDFE